MVKGRKISPRIGMIYVSNALFITSVKIDSWRIKNLGAKAANSAKIHPHPILLIL